MAIIETGHGNLWSWLRSWPWRSGGVNCWPVGGNPFHKICCSELHIIVCCLQCPTNLSLNKTHGHKRVLVAHFVAARRRQGKEYVISHFTGFLEKGATIHLHARIFKVVALLKKMSSST